MSKSGTNLIKEDDEFDILDFCRRHLRARAWTNARSQSYTAKELKELIKLVIEQLKKDETLVNLSPPCIIVGDIHGQYRDLIRILNFKNTKTLEETKKDGKNKRKKKEEIAKSIGMSTCRYMFLGDFVDRGPNSVECICLVFSLKCIFPDQYKLLRGNHETKETNFVYGFREELVDKIGQKDGIEVWNRFNEAFAWMPLAGLVGTKILCMHGGISPHLKSLDDIRNIKRPLSKPLDNTLAFDLMWSDPLIDFSIGKMKENTCESSLFIPNAHRSCSVSFSEKAVQECCKKLNINLIVRAHQVFDVGFRFFADKKLITIFSAPRYQGNNMASVLRVAENGGIAITVFAARKNDKEEANKDDKD
ncbi:unnamed protein product [Caenorhabditis angaria]|uniref:Serine/threonine-protein phosphatase n=1 Tax=Caenorhabditis angaria TaxID=860376 RepID=A0A9P1MRX2_9PELO|nr:unnamed protein product [Caenorhabditis angaria]